MFKKTPYLTQRLVCILLFFEHGKRILYTVKNLEAVPLQVVKTALLVAHHHSRGGWEGFARIHFPVKIKIERDGQE